MIARDIQAKILSLASKYSVITLTGPRQSGKSTLLRHSFPEYEYVSLEDPDMGDFAREDPRGFLDSHGDKVILDEVQRSPKLLSYIQTRTDLAGKPGMYILAGSQNFLLMQSISQSLAGRTAVLKLLPFSHKEMQQGGILPNSIAEEIFQGSYPGLYDKGLTPGEYYPFYIQTYLERDVRLLKNIGNQTAFLNFVKLCAGRIGQLLNLSSLAGDCGIAVSTAKEWLSILQASYICHLLVPDFNNYSKRLVKTPKLYFYDTGLACSLLAIRSAEQLSTHYLRGGLFENLVVNEFIKHSYNAAEEPNLTFWRDSTGNEVDLISYSGGTAHAYEIKSGATYSPDFFKGLNKWSTLSGATREECSVIYGGTTNLKTSKGDVIAF